MRYIVAVLFGAFVFTSSFGQHKMPEFTGEIVGKADRTEILQAKFVGVIDRSNDADKVYWMKSINKVASYKHGTPTPLDEIKAEQKLLRQNAAINEGSDVVSSSRSVDPEVGTNFLGNSLVNSIPPDNCMAISDGGKIISSDNSSIAFYNDNGSAILTNETHEDWLDDVAASINVTAGLFDPRVIYDPVEDRFILVILHGSSAFTSKVLICYSQTNNPAGNWNVYEISGNPFNDNSWFDYPNVAISESEVFITGNLFQSGSNGFNGSVVYQVDKAGGYAGTANLNYSIYNNIPGGQIGAFTLVPAGYGQDGEYGPGIYLVSSHFFSGNRLNLYEVTGNLSSNPALNLMSSFIVPSYTAPADAVQLGTFAELSTNDTRMQHAFYLNGTVHAVHHASYQNSGYSGVVYYRIPVDNPSANETARYGSVGVDYVFPSISSYALDTVDRTVMIGFLSVSSSIYPEIGVVNCDNFLEWSNPTLVRGGDSYTDYSWLSGTERWGDYSDMQRRHNAATPTIWMSGCFGTNGNEWNTWIAEIGGDFEPVPFPEAFFESDTNLIYQGESVFFSDSSINQPSAWNWTFDGGNPQTSSSQNNLVTYQDTGWFDVTLAVSNQFGSDTLTKESYIYVLSTDTAEPAAVSEIEKKMEMKVYPNPAIEYDLVNIYIDNEDWAQVDINIIDIQGRVVKAMYSDQMKPGVHRLTFNKLALSSGQYVVQVRRNGQITKNEKIIVL